MSSLALLEMALEYMEGNLSNDIKTDDVAKACYCSKSTLEKLFKSMNNMTVHDYLLRRRVVTGARILWENPNISILDVALTVGYSSNEAFGRAFKQVWNCKPSEFRKEKRYTELFPRLYAPIGQGDDYMTTRRQVDISELYDLIQERRQCYCVCCDIKNMIGLNEISYKAGDLGILETIKRMQDASESEDIIFRIGGDEFAILTQSEEVAYAQEIAKRILSHNGETYDVDGQQVPLNLYASVTKLNGKSIKYHELFSQLHKTIEENK